MHAVQGRKFSKQESFTIDIIHTGMEECRPGHEFGGSRSYHLVHVISSGKGWFGNRYGQWELGAGQAFVITPRDRHLYKADGTEPWTYWWIGFSINGWDPLAAVGIGPSNPVLRFSDSTMQQLWTYWDLIMHAGKDSDPGARLETTGYACSLLAVIASGRNIARTPDTTALQRGAADVALEGSPVGHHVQSMRMFIHHHVQSTINAHDVVSFAGLERSYASRIFKQHTGSSIGGYLLRERMELARTLLASGLSAKETAYSVGYRSYEHFLKMFKQYWRNNPSAFRKSQGTTTPTDPFQAQPETQSSRCPETDSAAGIRTGSVIH